MTQEWIDINDLPPLMDKPVLIYGNVKGMPTGFPKCVFAGIYTHMKGGNRFRSMGKTIIAKYWMIAPEPPNH